MTSISIVPVQLWSPSGVQTVSQIQFSEGVYNFENEFMNTSYSLLSSSNGALFTGVIAVPESVTSNWVSDDTVTNWCIAQLGLTKA